MTSSRSMYIVNIYLKERITVYHLTVYRQAIYIYVIKQQHFPLFSPADFGHYSKSLRPLFLLKEDAIFILRDVNLVDSGVGNMFGCVQVRVARLLKVANTPIALFILTRLPCHLVLPPGTLLCCLSRAGKKNRKTFFFKAVSHEWFFFSAFFLAGCLDLSFFFQQDGQYYSTVQLEYIKLVA